MNQLSDLILTKLLDSAKTAASHAYCKYSNFPVGAALYTKDGRIFSGCNVENISYGLTNCAERSALFNAVSSGVKAGEILGLLFYMPGNKFYSPCGACRQVMAEFISQDTKIYASSDLDHMKSWKMKELLPEGFEF
jgi:cytidine deaminase